MLLSLSKYLNTAGPSNFKMKIPFKQQICCLNGTILCYSIADPVARYRSQGFNRTACPTNSTTVVKMTTKIVFYYMFYTTFDVK